MMRRATPSGRNFMGMEAHAKCAGNGYGEDQSSTSRFATNGIETLQTGGWGNEAKEFAARNTRASVWLEVMPKLRADEDQEGPGKAGTIWSGRSALAGLADLPVPIVLKAFSPSCVSL